MNYQASVAGFKRARAYSPSQNDYLYEQVGTASRPGSSCKYISFSINITCSFIDTTTPLTPA